MSEDDLLTPRERAALERNPEASLACAPETDERIVKNEVVGVGGVLAFLVAILIFIGPMFTVFLTIMGHQDTLSLYPELDGSKEWRAALVLDWVSVVVQIALSVLAGMLLLKRQVRSTKWIVIAMIWLSAVGVSIGSLFVADSLFPGSLTAGDAGATLGRPIVFSVIWTLYLLISKRVRRTYSG